jgi:hypothetical protein
MDEARAYYGTEVPECYKVGYTDTNGDFLNKLDALDRARANKQVSADAAAKMLREQKRLESRRKLV